MPTTPEAVISAFVTRMQARDLPGLLALYEADAIFVPSPDVRAQGEAALREAFRATLAMEPTIEARPTEVLSSADLAWVTNAWRFRGTTPDGAAVERSGQSSVVMRRQVDGTWRIAIDRL
ncbi:MAG TPA: SgcJ/EcaC family oxidoreductase [Polyangia bacterium]|nr:SgcJ/EcaC family oxidoreductase [Polyangia bacterium]